MIDPLSEDIGVEQELLAQLGDEFVRRYRAGERPPVEEYALEHPALADDIRELFPAMLLIEQAGADPTAMTSPIERIGATVGNYTLLEQLGEGGFGVVFLAEQLLPVQRRVAMKVIKPGLDTRQVIARFEAERQAVALMDHANIAKVLDAGATESGRPYFVMELVDGIPITTFCDRHQFTPAQRLQLFVQVCRAVQHAHTKGIIHRDIKPSNVLVTRSDGIAVPKVIDFGVAKAVGQRALTDVTNFTLLAQMVGTPLYMSPEQAEMSSLDVDARSDVYSLGVLLYELLTGTTPFEKDRLRQATVDEVRRIIREEDPPRPSTRISTLGDELTKVSAQCRTDPRRLGQLLRGELDWIVMKCLEKDRTRRYEAPSDLAEDVLRYLNNGVVMARPPSRAYQVRKFILRHKLPVIAAAAVLAALLIGFAVSTVALIQARKARDTAVVARAAAESSNAQAVDANRFILDLITTGELDVQRAKMDAASANLDRGWLKEQPELQMGVRRYIAHQYRLMARNRSIADRDELLKSAEHHLRASIRLGEEVFGPRAPQTLGCVLELGELMYDREDRGDAESLLHRAIDGYRAAPSSSPNDLMRALVMLATIRDQQSDPAGAKVLRFQSMLEFVNWKLHQPLLSETAAQQFERGNLLCRVGRFAEALPYFQADLSLDPSNAEAWLLEAVIQLYTGDEAGFRQTRSALLARFKTNPSPEAAWTVAKLCLLLPMSPQELPEAKAVIEQALADHPPAQLAAWYELTRSFLLYREGSFAQAMQTLPHVPAGSPRSSPESGLAIIEYIRAACQHPLGANTDALASLERARAHLAAAPAPGAEDLEREGVSNVIIARILAREVEGLLDLATPATAPAN